MIPEKNKIYRLVSKYLSSQSDWGVGEYTGNTDHNEETKEVYYEFFVGRNEWAFFRESEIFAAE